MFHNTHVQILGSNHCGDSGQTAFKCRKSLQDVICRCNYYERVVAIFSHLIKSEYYSVNISMSVQGIAIEHFSAFP